MELAEAKQQMVASANTVTPMPVYQSHKTVWALKIKLVLLDLDGTGIIVPGNHGYAPFAVSAEYMSKHKPQAGGYFVQYKGGYQSYSPAEPFEDGYKELGQIGSDFAQDMAGIGWAIKQMRNGSRVRRTLWPAEFGDIKLDTPGTECQMIIRETEERTRSWTPVQDDLLATDWELVS